MSTTSTPIDPYKVPYKGELLDPYKIADLFEITDPVIFQALKKILRFGRKHKPLASDVREAITSLERWEALQKEKVPVNLGEYEPKPGSVIFVKGHPPQHAISPCPICQRSWALCKCNAQLNPINPVMVPNEPKALAGLPCPYCIPGIDNCNC